MSKYKLKFKQLNLYIGLTKNDFAIARVRVVERFKRL